MVEAHKSYSRILSEFATSLKYQDIPPDVVANVKEHIIDTMGCLLAGSTMDWMEKIKSVAKRLAGNPEATIIGDGTKIGVANAALFNGTLGRALDLDDTHLRSWDHMNAYIVPM
ncbi:MmgE/PrpD family protein [Chloroflexota bacterium]